MKIEFPHRLEHFANANGRSWRPKAANAKRVRQAVAWNLAPIRKRPALPCQVTMTRLAPRSFDSDNLLNACKPIRDEVAKWLGVDDRHDDRVRYVCAQQQTSAGQYFVRIEFQTLVPTSGGHHETDSGNASGSAGSI